MRPTATEEEYLLGHDPAELERLEQQAEILAPATTLLLEHAGVRPGMRVLDLGSGAGDVALMAAALVGSSGEVLGIDRSADALDLARARASRRGLRHITFAEGDVRDFHHEEFDAVIGRLVLLYLQDPASVVRHHASLLRPGGIVLAMEYDMLAARAFPACPNVDTAIAWITETFDRAGLDPALGPSLLAVMQRAGFEDAEILGVQPYLAPGRGARMVSGIVRTLLPVMEQTGVASAADVDMASLPTRLERELEAAGAVLAPPTLVGAWVRVR